MKNLITDYPLGPKPGAGSFYASNIINEILEENIPGLQERTVEITKKILFIIHSLHDIEIQLDLFLKKLRKEFTFNLQIVKTLLIGIQFYMDLYKFQTINDLDQFMDNKKKHFDQILLEGFQENDKDHASKPQGAK